MKALARALEVVVFGRQGGVEGIAGKTFEGGVIPPRRVVHLYWWSVIDVLTTHVADRVVEQYPGRCNLKLWET